MYSQLGIKSLVFGRLIDVNLCERAMSVLKLCFRFQPIESVIKLKESYNIDHIILPQEDIVSAKSFEAWKC